MCVTKSPSNHLRSRGGVLPFFACNIVSKSPWAGGEKKKLLEFHIFVFLTTSSNLAPPSCIYFFFDGVSGLFFAMSVFFFFFLSFFSFLAIFFPFFLMIFGFVVISGVKHHPEYFRGFSDLVKVIVAMFLFLIIFFSPQKNARIPQLTIAAAELVQKKMGGGMSEAYFLFCFNYLPPPALIVCLSCHF